MFLERALLAGGALFCFISISTASPKPDRWFSRELPEKSIISFRGPLASPVLELWDENGARYIARVRGSNGQLETLAAQWYVPGTFVGLDDRLAWIERSFGVTSVRLLDSGGLRSVVVPKKTRVERLVIGECSVAWIERSLSGVRILHHASWDGLSTAGPAPIIVLEDVERLAAISDQYVWTFLDAPDGRARLRTYRLHPTTLLRNEDSPREIAFAFPFRAEMTDSDGETFVRLRTIESGDVLGEWNACPPSRSLRVDADGAVAWIEGPDERAVLAVARADEAAPARQEIPASKPEPPISLGKGLFAIVDSRAGSLVLPEAATERLPRFLGCPFEVGSARIRTEKKWSSSFDEEMRKAFSKATPSAGATPALAKTSPKPEAVVPQPLGKELLPPLSRPVEEFVGPRLPAGVVQLPPPLLADRSSSAKPPFDTPPPPRPPTPPAETAPPLPQPGLSTLTTPTASVPGAPPVTTEPLASTLSLSIEPIIEESVPNLPERRPVPSADARSRDRALDWLRAQLGPILDSRSRARLIASYEGGQSAWIYDQGIAVIALLAAGDIKNAEAILAGLAQVQEPDGSWYFAYSTRSGQRDSPEIFLGTQAWGALAFVAHWEATRSDSFRRPLELALGYLRRWLDDGAGSPSFGGLRFSPGRPDTFSTEHASDAFSALDRFATLVDDPEVKGAADRLRDFVFRELWSCGPSSFSCPDAHFRVGFRDRDFYLDAQTWTTLAFSSRSSHRIDFPRAIDRALERLTVTNGSLQEARNLFGLVERHPSEDYIWSEGSEGMVAALLALGGSDRRNLASRIHEETRRYQAPTGGIPYATENLVGKTNSPSVAGTAWYLFNELGVNPFAALGGIDPLPEKAAPRRR